MNLTSVASQVEESDIGKDDIEVSVGELSVTDDGFISYGDRVLHPNDWAWYEIWSKASKGTTKSYMMKHPTDLWTQMLEFDLSEISNKQWLLRARHDDILGVVTPIYKIFNNRDVVRALQENLGSEHRVHRMFIDDKLFYVKILYPEAAFKIGDDTYHIGFITMNSEVGYRNLSNSTIVYRVGYNDAQLSRHASMSVRHAGRDFDEMSNSLGASIDAGKDLKTIYIELITNASMVEIKEDDIEENLEFVKRRLKLSGKKIKEIRDLFSNEAQTKMGLINSISMNAMGMRGDLRIMMESAAGSLLDAKFPCEGE